VRLLDLYRHTDPTSTGVLHISIAAIGRTW
jgi:hypothetical protein